VKDFPRTFDFYLELISPGLSTLHTTAYLRSLDLSGAELLVDLITHHKLYALMRLQPRNKPVLIVSHYYSYLRIHVHSASECSRCDTNELTSHALPTNAASHYSADES